LLLTARSAPPAGREWLHEIKYDGYRAQLHLRAGQARIFTRRGHDWTTRFPVIAAAAARLDAREAILDAEIVSPGEGGVPDFDALKQALAVQNTDGLLCYAFDLLYCDGWDLRRAPLVQRKRALQRLLGGGAPPLLYSEEWDAEGATVYEHACRLRLEGIVSKLRNSTYTSGRSDSWVKIKCSLTEQLPIVGFTAAGDSVASLRVGRRVDGQLLYAGKLSGFPAATARELRQRLEPMITPRQPLSKPIRKPQVTWVSPMLDAIVSYSSETSTGKLRHPSFAGLAQVPRGAPHKPSPRRAAKLAKRISGGAPYENILQELPDAIAPTKEQLATYWSRVWRRALVHLGGRPLKLVRRDKGTIFYHMGPLPPVPASVHLLTLKKRGGGEGTRLWVDDLAGLLGLVEIGAIELHPWAARVDDIEHPDLLVFDLDPGEGIGWEFVIESALAMRDLLSGKGLASWPKTTGGKGLHVMVPIDARLTHDAAHALARDLARRLAARASQRYTISAALAERPGRLFIDYLRNGRGTTAIGAYSPRARPGFPVAAPLTWAQVERGVRSDAFTMDNPPRTARDRRIR
jgi:bifunctional non-homologous end joining protein LigD